MKLRRIFYLLAVALLPVACSSKVPDGRVLVRNDSEDTSFNIIEVYNESFSHTLKPGESLLLPPHTAMFTLARNYRELRREYRISCPYEPRSGILIKMLDAHLNRLAGGCTLEFAGATQRW